jgi:small neutral amino acid transporter SnatA (MarC family)
MIHGHEDAFVGTVAVALGLFLLTCAVTNWPWYYSFRSAQWLRRWLGRRGARVFHALLGLGLIALGIAIARGFRWTILPAF